MDKTVFFDEKRTRDAALILFDGQGIIETRSLGLITTIGRASAQIDCDIRIHSPIVSRAHGEIIRLYGTYYYKDLNSTNGTYVNRMLIGGQTADRQTVELRDGDVLCFDIREDGQSRPDRVFALFAAFCDAESRWSTLELSNDIAEICVGRSARSGLQIENEAISEKHASFFCSVNGWAIIDHQSTNGVYLNGRRLSAPRYLKPFDTVRIADAYFIFTGDRLLCSQGGPAPADDGTAQRQAPASVLPADREGLQTPPQGRLVIDITERSVMQRFKKMLLLQDIRLSVSDGEMVLILGGSGAGKTTFINAVMGYEKATGRVLYRDTDIYAEYERMKYEIGFVPQQDLLRGSDTVYETLANAAEMKLPRSMSDDKREERIAAVLEELGLSREKETLVSKLSGGQRKRLSIAVEFVADPSLFFLDEPDSGVDDIMGRGLMENLRQIADRGKIVMVITHSPERAADLFDKVIVLAKSTRDNCGHLAFYGSCSQAFRFFEASSFREIVKKVNRTDENGDGLSDYYIDKYAACGKG